MAKYKAGDKFIIEIETHYNHSGEKNSTRPLNDNDGADVSELYRIRGFRSLVFDKAGLMKLEPLKDELTAREYLELKHWYCTEYGYLAGWCLYDYRDPDEFDEIIERVQELQKEHRQKKVEEDRMADIMYELEDVISEYGIDDVRKALEEKGNEK